ncbi:hypothetical protein DPMN_143323 [Dreissena polymorpha]|uniref:Mab-21-like HhH/H2TH-like domain-containing protein n=1 Tax=Dreissena polymorpha TaxID=45954 RepID=A0A9D4GCY3_DREPO|nr:hypothetical protein DPMN_143323 [Dreissena polymorpha]
MPQDRPSKHKHTTRKEKHACKTVYDVAGSATSDKEFSERLSRILDRLAFNEHLLQFKRKMFYSYEREMTLVHKALGRNRRTYIFGSQIEGTSTIGMMSDIDILHRFEMFRLYLDSETPPLQPHDNQVVLKVSTNGCASQYCFLLMDEPFKQARNFQKILNLNPIDIVRLCLTDWAQTDVMITHVIMFDTHRRNPDMVKHANRNGPADTIWNMDNVKACYCKSVPKQCKFVFHRPRPGHWPSEKTLRKATKYGVFIVPQGPPKHTNICTYDYFHYHWRMSTNLIERLFMLSLQKVHLKSYVLTKMIRKELFVPEYRERLSTFHFKTALFFAVENTRPDLWREDSLINCVKYILVTLRRFLIRRNCPHFTIENVNLFDGKIERHEFQKLEHILTYVINSLRTRIENIQMDNIGNTLKEYGTSETYCRRYCKIESVLFKYVYTIFQGVTQFVYAEFSEKKLNERKAAVDRELTLLETYVRAPSEKYRKYVYTLHGLMSIMASVSASIYLEHKTEGHEYNSDGINKARNMYIKSLESEIIGNYMRYASFLFCNQEYNEACTYFDLIEQKIQEDKKTNLIDQLFICPSESLALQIAKQSWEKTFTQRWSLFLMFRQAEAMCVPKFLHCEMYRGSFGTYLSSECMSQFYSNYDCICVKTEPYLYFLQYLTYKELHQEPKKLEALEKLSQFTKISVYTRLVAFDYDVVLPFANLDTSLNMLGHCMELEENFELAWENYKYSIQLLPQRNAAVLHIIRLLWKVSQSLPICELQS